MKIKGVFLFTILIFVAQFFFHPVAYSAPDANSILHQQQDLAEIIAPGVVAIKDLIIKDPPFALNADQYQEALMQISRFAKSENEQCQLAMQIIIDQIPRTKALCSDICLDGIREEWRTALPSLQETRWPDETLDQARDIWKNGIAAVVRQNIFYVMCGLKDKNYFEQPENVLDMRIDCAYDRDWDVVIHLICEKGTFKASFENFTGKSEWPVSGPIKKFQTAINEVVEIAIPIEQFVPTDLAKPIWNFNASVHTFQNKQSFYPQTRRISIYNESAVTGVSAKDFLHPFLLLAADVGLNQDDLTAAAIAITSATIYSTSNQEVRVQLRKDNAELLRFARNLDCWQKSEKLNYSLSQYPLEAQIAWANRLIWLGLRYLSWNHNSVKFYYNDMENYSWSFIDIPTLYKLKDMAVREKLISSDIDQTAKNIDQWVTSKLARRGRDEDIELHKNQLDVPTYGQFKDTPVYEVFARHTRSYIQAVEETGHFYGGCPDQSWVTQDILRSVGIAPIAFGAASAGENRVGHCWAGFYQPQMEKWISFQPGRSGKHYWYFNIDRVAVFPYVSTAYRGGCNRYYELFRNPVVGEKIFQATQKGIPTNKIREWMLSPVIE
jgi:hypothetical protein